MKKEDKTIVQRINTMIYNHVGRSISSHANISVALGRTERQKLLEEAHYIQGSLPSDLIQTSLKVTQVLGYDIVEVDKEWYIGLIIEEDEE